MKKILLIALGVVVVGGLAYYLGIAVNERRENEAYQKFYGVSKDEAQAQLELSLSTVDVYLERGTTDGQALVLKAEIEKQPWVKNVTYISAEQQLAEFKEKHKNDPTINQALSELAENPLLAEIEITLAQCPQRETAEAFVKASESYSIVEHIRVSSTPCDRKVPDFSQ